MTDQAHSSVSAITEPEHSLGRPLAQDWFVVFTYTLVIAAGVMQFFLLLWLDVF